MEHLKLGQIINESQNRDAIHIAVAPMVAQETLAPGTHVGVEGDACFKSVSPVGVVDPFLKKPVQKGQRFWLFLYPGSITSLRHEWTHRDFTAGLAPAEASRIWIEAFAADIDQTYNRLMEAAQSWVDYGDYTYDNSESYKEHWDKFPEFWKHYEIVTGKQVADKESSFFTCSC